MEPNGSPVSRCNAGDNRQAQSTAPFFMAAATVKAAKYTRAFVRRNSWAIIPYPQANEIVVVIDGDVNPPARLGISQCIVDQIPEEGAHVVRVPIDDCPDGGRRNAQVDSFGAGSDVAIRHA